MNDPDIIAELREINERLTRIERALQPDDADDTADLLTVIAAAVGSEPFTCSEVLAYPGVRIAAKGASPEKLGKRFIRLQAEQDRVIAKDVPKGIAECFAKCYGESFLGIPEVSMAYLKVVTLVQSMIRAKVDEANKLFDEQRAAGFKVH